MNVEAEDGGLRLAEALLLARFWGKQLDHFTSKSSDIIVL